MLSSRKRPDLNGQIDIVVAMPFESMYQSQWIQFNFDQVRHFLRPNGVIIPQQTRLSIAPVMSSKIYNKIRHGEVNIDSAEIDTLAYATRSQCIYKVYPKSFYQCAPPKVVFSFDHRSSTPFCSITETEIANVTFVSKLQCSVVGFFGFFEAKLHQHIVISNLRMEEIDDLICPALTYYPLAIPQPLLARQTLHVTFQQCLDAKENCAWLEWKTSAPFASTVHNFMGRIHRMTFKRKDQIDDI